VFNFGRPGVILGLLSSSLRPYPSYFTMHRLLAARDVILFN